MHENSRFEIHYAAPDFHPLRQLELHIREAVRPVESFFLPRSVVHYITFPGISPRHYDAQLAIRGGGFPVPYKTERDEAPSVSDSSTFPGAVAFKGARRPFISLSLFLLELLHASPRDGCTRGRCARIRQPPRNYLTRLFSRPTDISIAD